MPSLRKPPNATTERVAERGLKSKTWDTADGRRVFTAVNAVQHKPDDYAKWRSGQKHGWGNVNSKPVQNAGKFGIPDAWYTLDFDPAGMILTATWIDGSVVVIDLLITPHRNMAAEIIGDSVFLRNVRPGLDLEARFWAEQFEIYKIVKTAQAPHTLNYTFRWKSVDFDVRPAPLAEMAFDAADFRAELGLSVSAERVAADGFTEVDFTEVLTGKTVAVQREPESGWTRDAVYPVTIDTTFGPADITVDADDCFNQSGTFQTSYNNAFYFGQSGYSFSAGLRWDGITIPNAATINSATIQISVVAIVGTPVGDIWGHDADDPVAYGSGDLPSNTSPLTTASTAISDTGTGSKSYTITSIVQELVDRVGWASGQAMRFAFIETTAPTNWWRARDSVTGSGDLPTLTIDYTAAAGGGDGTDLPWPQTPTPAMPPPQVVTN